MKTGIIDIESTDLLANMIDFTSFPYKKKEEAKLWCVVIRDYHTDEVWSASLDEITPEWLDHTLSRFEMIIAHNGIKFDLPALKLFGMMTYTIGGLDQTDTLNGRPVRFLDTLILSRLLNPDRLGGHSLGAWGKRTGNFKDGFREICISEGLITKQSPKGAEFKQWTPSMVPYCGQDTSSNASTYTELVKELGTYAGWKMAIRQEHKLADIGIKRETLGFWFDRPAALKCVEDLTQKMEDLTNIVNPNLPERPLGKGELKLYTPPKIQVKANGEYAANFLGFLDKVGANLAENTVYLEGKAFPLPLLEPLKTTVTATIDDLDAVKMHLIALGWEPTEWRERDLTKDSKKINLPLDKRIAALDRWYADTIGGKYKDKRLAILKTKEENVYNLLRKKLNDNKPVRVPTSPSVRVGVEKELCPNLVQLGEKVAFARDFADYLTYKHRKSTIAGGDIDEMDFDTEAPNTGFLSVYREEDGRVPTPAIEIGASTNRYKHISVANVPRPSSKYGKEMRSLFGAGAGFVQLGYDFASLEARIEGHYVHDYTDGIALGDALIAEKPNDIHTLTGLKLGIPRIDAKSVNYAVLYGAQPAKLAKMLACSLERAKEVYDEFWLAVPALKELKDKVEQEWLANGKLFIRGIDGRKINIRSQHSILNALFQSAGVICAKYTTVLLVQDLEQKGYCVDPFEGTPDVCSMIEYHDEAQLLLRKDLAEYKLFDTKEEAEEFVKTWRGYQLGAVSEGKSQWYVTMPNDVSIAIDNSIQKVCKLMDLKVPLGYEFNVGRNWYQCH